MNWISVKDRLPENDVEVLVCIRNEYMDVAFVTTTALSWHKERIWELSNQPCDQYSADDYITHWMPLPEKPKEK